ncbi:MAG: glycosyl hydrolase, partial [bacterium]|nr:glycosyl hydrolase [bacterium]
MRRMSVVAVVGTLMFGFFTSPCVVAEVAEEPRMVSETFSGLKLRGIGPAFMSGRISQVAKDPSDSSVWYVAVSSGGVWKTVNTGTTWKPIFDHYGAYSIGSVAVDPKNPHVVWVGTGEGNSQRSVGWGDGIYKSLDGGESFTNMGLKTSEHIGQIAIDPRDSDIVWVAAQGSLWKAGGDRGLYKTIDGGETWERLLHISDNTGIADVVLDPRNPDVVYASSYQRRRRVWTLIAGGPESGIHKSTDGGRTWRKQSKGLPSVHLGRIGLAVSPIDPDVVYAIIAAEGDHSGFYRSSNLGETWVRMSDYSVVDPQYYQRIYPDPHRFDRVYSMDVIMHVTEDGGKTFSRVDNSARHVDNHCMLFDADNPNYLLVGGDGGLYESWDRGKTYRFIDNLPVTQFYRVAADNDLPFYNVYGGTQDNSTQGGPSRTLNRSGIRNSDWFITVGGDGYQTRIDPDDPNILYSMYQYGGLIRYDRRNGELVDIQPQPGVDDEPLVWNWDSPLLISPHSGSRLYFAADRLFRSDDRGDSWTAVSPDLTRNVNRDELPVMGRVWSVDAVWKNVFTSIYGNIVALDESTLVEGLIYVG